jgi:hypothetical protein
MPIAARFHELRNAILASVDLKFAEPIRFLFLKAGVPDATRVSVVADAVLRVGEGKTTSVAAGRGEGWRSRIMADKAELHIDPAAYAGPVIKVGDKIKALSRAGEPLFEVAGIDDRSHTRLVLQLTEA